MGIGDIFSFGTGWFGKGGIFGFVEGFGVRLVEGFIVRFFRLGGRLSLAMHIQIVKGKIFKF